MSSIRWTISIGVSIDGKRWLMKWEKLQKILHLYSNLMQVNLI